MQQISLKQKSVLFWFFVSKLAKIEQRNCGAPRPWAASDDILSREAGEDTPEVLP